jgi:hypothetical protein
MKAFRILITVVSFCVILILTGCGGKGSPAESTQDKQLGLLSQTWKITGSNSNGSVSLDQNPQTSWSGFQLTITGTKGGSTFNYTCAGRPALGPWPASGTWKFGTDPVTQIIRIEDNLNMTYTVTPTTLQITFNYTGTGFTRVNQVGGTWVFNFVL